MQKKPPRPTRKNIFGNQPQIAPGVHPGVKIDQLQQLKCACGHELFIGASRIHYASPLQSVSGGPTLVQVARGFMCTSCGELNKFDTSKIPSLTPPTETKQ